MKRTWPLSPSEYGAIVAADIAYLKRLPSTPERDRQIESLRMSAEMYVPPFTRLGE